MNRIPFRKFFCLSLLIGFAAAGTLAHRAGAADADGFVSVSDQVVQTSGIWAGAPYNSQFVHNGPTVSPPSGPNWAESPYSPVLESAVTLTASAVFLQRVGSDVGTLVQNSLVPGQGLDSSDIRFDFQPGFDVAAVIYREYLPELEVRFLSIDDWNEPILVPTTPGFNGLRINTSPLTFTAPGVTAIAGEYDSKLHNFETNLRLNLGTFKPLAGFRYLELDERLFLGFPPTTNTYEVSTRNRLYGGQLGLLVQHTTDNLTLNLAGKGGVFGNAAGQSTGFFTGLVPVTAVDKTAGVSFLGEMSANAELHLTEKVSLAAGYQMMWLTGVMLAANQIPATDLLVRQGGTDRDAVFYHGGLFSVVIRH